ncbi:MAG: hypothetical protein MHM6MM_006153 [Cercozoa sp. M6MM]
MRYLNAAIILSCVSVAFLCFEVVALLRQFVFFVVVMSGRAPLQATTTVSPLVPPMCLIDFNVSNETTLSPLDSEVALLGNSTSPPMCLENSNTSNFRQIEDIFLQQELDEQMMTTSTPVPGCPPITP